MTKTPNRWDVAILGSGVGGSILGAILSRHGLRVLIVELGVHPRFAIGESTVPETTFNFRVLAQRYDVPEIGYLASHQLTRRHVAATCGVKRNFSFATHHDGERQRPDETSQFPTLSPPLGPDIHFFRQDVDAYMMHTAIAYGATVRQGVNVTNVEISPAGVRLEAKSGEVFEASYIVDAGGIQALLPRLLGLREEPCNLRTRSRAIYTHLVGVLPYDACFEAPGGHGLPSPMSQGTLHHLFEGGWCWVIPFDNHPDSTNRLCSVGLVLNVDKHPARGLSGEAEFREIVSRYPSMQRQFGNAVAVRDWMSTGRLQFSSKTAVGDRFCLLPHAAAFVDPLFSSGLGITTNAINQMAHRIIAAAKDGDWSGERFRHVDTWMKRNVDYFDRLVSCAYMTFGDFELWNAWQKYWMVGSFIGATGVTELLGRHHKTGDRGVFDAGETAPFRGIQAIDQPEVAALFARGEAALLALRDGHISRAEAISRLYATLDGSGLWPAPWGPAVTTTRHPGLFRLSELAAVRAWMNKRSPAALRGTYLVDFDLGTLTNYAARDWTAELMSSGKALAAHSRDFMRGWNEDWVD